MPFRFLLALLACLFFASAAFAAEPIFPPGSRIGLTPPPGMAPSRAIQGFEDRQHGVLLLVTELSAQSYEKVARDFAPEGMQGMEELARETIALASGEGLLVGRRQRQNGVPTGQRTVLTDTV